MPIKNIRDFVQPFVKKAALMGLSANETLRILRSLGLGYRRSVFLADFRMYKKIPLLRNRLKYVPRKYRPSKDLFLQPKRWMSRRFAFTTEFRILKPETGEIFKMYSRVATDRWLTRGQAERRALRQIKSAIDRSKYEIVDYVLVEAWHKEGEPW